MVENTDSIIHFTDILADKVVNTKEYKGYIKALSYIEERPELMKQVSRLKKLHFDFAQHRESNNYSFDEEKYVSQEFYKMMLDRHVEDYFLNEHKLVKLLCRIYCHISERCFLDIFYS